MLSLCYFTSRKDPKIQWFFDSLRHQLNGDNIEIIVIDFHANEPGRKVEFDRMAGRPLVHQTPKPNVWQGPHRLTKQNWFSVSNARNTAVCLAKGSHIAFVDDLSVLQPGWLECVWQSMRENYVALGAYQKMKQLVVEDGIVKSYQPWSSDCRLTLTSQDQTSCAGEWLYGCSCAMPLEAPLTVNGFPEDLCDGLGFEDVCFGIALGNTNQFTFRYDRRMMTYESEEDHFKDEPMRKTDKGVSPRDKSHAALGIARGSKYYPNQFNLRELRARIQAGEPFPIQQTPQHDWYDQQPIAEMFMP